MDFRSFLIWTSSLHTRAYHSVKRETLDQSRLLMKDFQKRSPVDSGFFKSMWHISNVGGGEGISYSIRNNLIYATFLDQGAEPGGAPWYFPNAKNKGSVSKSGKLKKQSNKVWAGGLSPEGFVTGGISGKIVLDSKRRQNQIARAIADSIIKVFKS